MYSLMATTVWSICIVCSWNSRIIPNLAKVLMPNIKLNIGSSSDLSMISISGRIENILDFENAGNIIPKLPTCLFLNVPFEVCQVSAAYLFSLGMLFIFCFVINSRSPSEPLSSRDLHQTWDGSPYVLYVFL